MDDRVRFGRWVVIAVGHAGLELYLVPFDQIGVFVTVHADAVTYAVLEERVLGTETRIFNDLPTCGIDRFTSYSRTN